MRESISLPSGAIFEFEIAPTQAALRMNRIIAKEIKAAGLDLSKFGESGISDALNGKAIPPAALQLFIDIACQAIGSEELDRAVFDCSPKSLYNGQRVIVSSFDPEESRQDYYPFCKEVIMRNSAPFFKGVGSLLSMLPKGAAKSLP